MGKNKKKSKQAAAGNPKATTEKKNFALTMADLQAMSDSEDDSDLPPEEEWDADAKALKKAIEAGAFDNAMVAYQEEGDDESVEEVALENGDGDDDDDDEEFDAEEADDDEAESEDEEDIEKSKEVGMSESEEEESEQEEEDEPDSKPKSTPEKPQHKKDSSAKQQSEDLDSDEEEERDAEESEEEEEEKKKINENMNTKAIRVVTEDLEAFRNSMPWAESFVVVPSTTSPFAPGVEDPLDIHDDLKREVAFYDLALEAALTARKKCEQAKVSFSRPEDFFAEMVKTDGKNRTLNSDNVAHGIHVE